MNDVNTIISEVDDQMDSVRYGAHNSGYSETSGLRVDFHDAVAKPWAEAAGAIRKLAKAQTDPDKMDAMADAVSNVMRTLNAAQQHAWVASNILEALKRGDTAQSIAKNMETAGVIDAGSLSHYLNNQRPQWESAQELGSTSRWITAHTSRIVLMMAKVLDRVLAVVATLVKVKPRIGMVLGLAPALDVSWDVDGVSAKELIDAILKGFHG